MPQHQDLTDAQWEVLQRLIPEPERRADGRGRPWKGRREVVDGILYILRNGRAWADLPDCYPPYQTCHRRFQQWVRSGVMQAVLEALDEDQHVRREPELREPSTEGSLRLNAWLEVSGSQPSKPTATATMLLEQRSRR
jgi:transposase